MKQKLGFVAIILLWMTIYKITIMQTDPILDVTYKKTTQFGIVFDVPDHWEENYDSNQNTYYYKDRTKDFYLQVYYKKPMNLTMEQYIFYHQQFLSANLLSDNVTSLDFPTTNLEDESVITYKVLSMNEQTIGYVESNGKDQNQNHMISRYYSIKKEDSVFILAFHCKTRKLKHYKAMFEHIVSSVECY